MVVKCVIKENIKGVFKPYDVIINIKEPTSFAEKNYGSHMDQFGSTSTFILLPENLNKEEFSKKLHNSYLEIWPNLWDKDKDFIGGVSLIKLNDIYFTDLRSNLRKGEKKKVKIIILAGIILIISAIFN